LAVNVTTVPPATEDTAFPPEVIERVVAVAEDALAGWDPPHQARQTIASAQRNEWSRADTFSPATVRRERMPTLSRLKQVVLHGYLTQPVRVLFPPDIGLLGICASCFDENELEDREYACLKTDVSVNEATQAEFWHAHPLVDKLAYKIIAKYHGTFREQLRVQTAKPKSPPSAEEEKVSQLLKSNPGTRKPSSTRSLHPPQTRCSTAA
jgi:hypothetical protein